MAFSTNEPLSDIVDVRDDKQFRLISFSGFKRTDVKKELVACLVDGKMEPACYWSAELVCAGHFSDLWDIYIQFFANYIHIVNPKISVYIEYRYSLFCALRNGGFLEQELRLRNNPKIRRMFAELACVLCSSKRKQKSTEKKVKPDEYLMEVVEMRLRADTSEFAEAVFREEDPTELFIAINELGYHLSVSGGKNGTDACYWVEWILNFDAMCKSQKQPLECERRMFAHADAKYQKETVWMIWDVFLHEASERNAFIQKVVNATLELFCADYRSGHAKRRKWLMYFIIELFTMPFHTDEPIVREKEQVQLHVQNIHYIYAQIKRNEEAPDLQYLQFGDSSANIDKTIAQLNAMEQFEMD